MELTVPIKVEFDEEKMRKVIEKYIDEHDVVEVVRCKNCQHSCIDENWCECRLLEIGVDEDFYCADGEVTE